MTGFRTSSPRGRRVYRGRRRFEHWYRDDCVYFITARVRDRLPAFAGEAAKGIFWEQFERYAAEFGFVPWVTSLLDNHYHTIGFLRCGENLGMLMQRLHGATAKLVNDTLPTRITPFWADAKNHGYFDGCLRDVKQGRLTYRYVLTQAKRHGIVADWRDYPHTRVNVAMDRALQRAEALRGFMQGVGYRRYDGGGRGGHGR